MTTKKQPSGHRPIQKAGKVQQHFKEEVDINNIMERAVGGQMHMGNANEPQYIDNSNEMSYHEMLNRVTYAKQQFLKLPAELRLKFNNDPNQLIEFISDDKNKLAAAKMGLLNEEVTQEIREDYQEQQQNLVKDADELTALRAEKAQRTQSTSSGIEGEN